MDCTMRLLGNTGIRTSIIGLGGGQLARNSLNVGVATVRRAVDLGVTYFDSAPAYEQGASQVIMGIGLQDAPDECVLATKIGYLGTPKLHRSQDACMAQLYENLRSLQRPSVDILQVHLVERAAWWKKDASTNEVISIDDQYNFAQSPVMQFLQAAREQALCKYTGITSDRADLMTLILPKVDVDICLVAYAYNLIYRSGANRVLPLARKQGVAYLTAGIFYPALAGEQQDLISDNNTEIAPDIRKCLASIYTIQRETDISLVELGIRYLIADNNISTILVGAATPSEIEECVVAGEKGPLPADIHDALDTIGLDSFAQLPV